MNNDEGQVSGIAAVHLRISVSLRAAFLLAILLVLGGGQLSLAQGESTRSIVRPLFLDDIEMIFSNESRESGRRRNYNTERIETERHDFTQSVETLGPGGVQWEFGYTYLYSDHNDEIEHAHTAPETMIRFGLTDNIEFRLRTNYAWEFGEEHRAGSEDLRWSFKLGMTEYDECFHWRPESALELRFTTPTAGETFSTDRVEFGLDYIYGWPITERLELYGSTGYMTNGLGDFALVGDPASEDSFNAWSQSFAFGLELTESSTIYSEFFGIFTDGREDDLSLVFYNIGIDYYVTDDFVLDVRSGLGLTEESEDFFVGVGGGVRF